MILFLSYGRETTLEPTLENILSKIVVKKHSSNRPVITGSRRRENQSHPPSVIFSSGTRRGRYYGTFYAITKSRGVLVGYQSKNGIDWEEAGIVLRRTLPYENRKLGYPVFLFYPNQNMYHIYYGFESSDGEWSISHATSSNPLEGYEKDSLNPIYTKDNYLEQSGSDEQDGSELFGVVPNDFYKKEGKYYLLITTFEKTGNDPFKKNRLARISGNDWASFSFENVFLETDDLNDESYILQVPSVIEFPGLGYFMSVTKGISGDVHRERELFFGHSTDFSHFDLYDSPYLQVSESIEKWDSRRVYAAQWLKKQDGNYLTPQEINGKYYIYFSGHSLSQKKYQNIIIDENVGQTGLAEVYLDEDLFTQDNNLLIQNNN
jgi:hypothetical protein